MSRVFSLEEVAQHSSETDCFIAVNGVVLNVSSYLSQHPGGKKVDILYSYLMNEIFRFKYSNETGLFTNLVSSSAFRVLPHSPLPTF